jgi:heparan-alpha-glucosaminide N-acetyltransferase
MVDQPVFKAALLGKPAVAPNVAPPSRLVSLDTYRGLVMLLMASEGLGLAEVAKHFPDSGVWRELARQSDHARWQGCTMWDLIMPAFLFIVGVAVPFSLASRRRRGQGSVRILGHAVWRSVVLVLLGVLIMSEGAARTNFNFINVLAQIGLGYWVVVLLAERGWWVQLAAIVLILVGDWLWFAMYIPPSDFDFTTVQPAGWRQLEGFAAHWDLNTNPSAAFDRWFLNLFPRGEPFRFREGGGTTLNFVPGIATMLIGVMAGGWLRSGRGEGQIVRGLLVVGAALVIVGIALDPAILPGVETMRYSVCPIIKRLWTPSYVLYSGGWVMLAAAVLYWVVDVLKWRRWTFLFVVVGMNSLVMYLLAAFLDGWTRRTLNTHFGVLFGGTFGPMLESAAVLVVFWLVCWWLYRRRVFVKV